MNERINELINQCFIGTSDGNLSDLNTVANIEKFAELIVQECVEVIDVGGEFVSRPKMVERLRQHFEVKE